MGKLFLILAICAALIGASYAGHASTPAVSLAMAPTISAP